MFGSGSLKVLVVCFLLLRLNFDRANHNRQRAAMMPMMVGTVVRMVLMMSSTEAHRWFVLFTKLADLYLTGDLRVKPFTMALPKSRTDYFHPVDFVEEARRADMK